MFWSFKLIYKVQRWNYCVYSFLKYFLLLLFATQILIIDANQKNHDHHQELSPNSRSVNLNKSKFPLAQTIDLVIPNNDTSNPKLISQTKSILLHAFGQKYYLNLECLANKNNRSENLNLLYYSKNSYSNHKNSKILFSSTTSCLCNGYVNGDQYSTASFDLCDKNQLVGRFRVNKTDYFIQPDTDPEAFKHLSQNLLANKQNFIKTEITYGIIDNKISIFQPHAIYKNTQSEKSNTSPLNSTSLLETCILIGKKKGNHINGNGSRVTKHNRLNNITELEHKKESSGRFRRSSVSDVTQHKYPYVLDKKIYVELMVVVDKKMKDYYGDNLENHVQMLMFLTTQMYQHTSLINPLRIYLTDIIYISELNEHETQDLHVIWDAEKTLSNFCSWQNSLVKTKSLAKPDVSILITKEDICKSRTVCQTLGMAKLGQVCVPEQNCALIEDSGINTAYTIAHEIGHLVGMKHAEESRCKYDDNQSTQMMASVLDLTKPDYEWSNCSVMELNEFLRIDTPACLFNISEKLGSPYVGSSYTLDDTYEQFSDEIKLKATYPGQLQTYELKNQCQQIFGQDSDVCDHNLDQECKILWCKAGNRNMENAAIQCVTTNTKWADGTPCGIYEPGYQFRSAKLCMNGRCVLKSSEEARVVDGQWSAWGEFSECSRTCGGGIKKRYRSCNSPKPKNGGKYCIGERFDYLSCRTQKCPDDSDFRDLQCVLAAIKTSSSKNNLKLKGFEGVSANSWKAYHSPDPRKMCSLICMPEGSSNFAVLANEVIDGTKCSPEIDDVCVNGFCLPAGCDNILYSKKKNDNCGVCDGDNRTCDEVGETVDAPTTYGYNRVLDIPSRATNINIIRKRSGDDLGCLALRTNRENVYILNGHYVISKSTLSTKFEGIRIDYIVDDSKEIIRSVGNFSQPLQVQFLAGSINSKSDNGVIKYVYFLPKQFIQKINLAQQINNTTKHNSKYGSNSKIHANDDETNNKYQPLKYINRASNSKLRSQIGVESQGLPCNRLCNGVEKILASFDGDQAKYIERPCNTHCVMHLFSSPGQCVPTNGECGKGLELPKLRCIKHEKLSNLGVEVDLANCDQYEIFKANTSYTKICEVQCVIFKWQAIDSACSVTCGEGHKFRYYKCLDLRINQLVKPTNCAHMTKPDSAYLKCNQSCYKWQTSSWTHCSKSCGGGERQREIYCVFNNLNVVDNSFCSGNSLPVSKEICNIDACPAWIVGEWSACSCQTGKRNRTVTCFYSDLPTSITACKSLSKPVTHEKCSHSNCPIWKVGLWNSCSATCGSGFKTREVYCTVESRNFSESHVNQIESTSALSRLVLINSQLMDKRIDPSMCNENEKPIDLVECSVDRECYEWRTSYWTSCSVTCGHGIKMRRVYCSGRLDDCAALPKPTVVEECVMPPCIAEWQISEWSKCNGNCKLGWKTRDVRCVDKENNTLAQYYCASKVKPFYRHHCVNCGTWKSDEWSECSISCGQGLQSRSVSCISEQLEVMPDENCNEEAKPERVQNCTIVCQVEPDYQWKIISYGKCSVKCGIGWKFRHIVCQNKDGSNSEQCAQKDKPKYYEQCNSGPCPRWEHGDWSICSSNCGMGVQQRLVVCREINGTILEDLSCRHLTRPNSSLECIGRSCGHWSAEAWSACDFKTCTVIRDVKCISERNISMTEVFCDSVSKPVYSQQCPDTKFCESYQKYLISNYNHSLLYMGVLSYTNWSACSAKCGRGNQSRDVLCLFASKHSIVLPISQCDTKSVESTFRECQIADCQFKLVKKWGKCSKPCGQRGVQILEQKCLGEETNQHHDLSSCGISDEENTNKITRACFNSCQDNKGKYLWHVGKWTECSSSCGLANMTRNVFCWDKTFNKRAPSSKCSPRYEPISTVPCMNVTCGFGWFVSEWSSCSKKCSLGFKNRTVTCMQIDKDGQLINKSSSNCALEEKPLTQIPCNYGECDGKYFWAPEKWSECSSSCGFGHKKRLIQCLNRNKTKVHLHNCNKRNMPIKSQICFTNCYSISCFDLKSSFGVTNDGEYKLNVSNKIAEIYCHNMNSSSKPVEFLTLKSGESQNFAEIYEKRLIQPNKCTFGPQYGANCSFCMNETVPNHGITLFSKVRIDVQKLKLIENDFTFAFVKYGNPVSFGTAGDCYSSVSECQQARLNINLRGTSFVLAKDVKWVNYGEKPYSRINFSRDKSTVYGRCGGLCGFCRPDPLTGIHLEVV